MNAWAPAGRAICEELGNMALLEEMYHWGRDLRFQKLMPFPVRSLCLILLDQDVNRLQLKHDACLLSALLSTTMKLDSPAAAVGFKPTLSSIRHLSILSQEVSN